MPVPEISSSHEAARTAKRALYEGFLEQDTYLQETGRRRLKEKHQTQKEEQLGRRLRQGACTVLRGVGEGPNVEIFL